MGQILTASCVCGFARQILIGRGLEDTGRYPLPALCEACHELVIADFNNPVCPACGQRPVFYGEMDHKYVGFEPYTGKKAVLKKTAYRRTGHSDLILAEPNAANIYWCPKCGKKTLKFNYDGFWN
jgi:hypothetical protein